MVCVTSEGHGILEIWDLAGGGAEPQKKTLEITLNVRVSELVHRVSSLCERTVGSFGLILKWGRQKVNLMKVRRDQTIADIGVDFTLGTTHTLLITEWPSSPLESDELIELSDKDTRKLTEIGVDFSEVPSELPTNDMETKGLTQNDDDAATIEYRTTDESELEKGDWAKAKKRYEINRRVRRAQLGRRDDGINQGSAIANVGQANPEEGFENRRESTGWKRLADWLVYKEEGESNSRGATAHAGPGEQEESEVNRRGTPAYVGLVNQAMTCYLNSLLQALYMTPEFRNALYNWEYVNGSEKDEANSIPYQLQKLFLNLQTSSKNAIETTSLTKSFGWDSTEAWQQHDIQELCRVMFDALEQKFKNTEQADLINRLYEGKMIDYVKCLECGTEKSREDIFLDIPLPVRPFGSTVAYNSVEEALGAFVQPETLDGTNQYHCETCNKKCDAHKGLKFTKFPYFLTLHLKRFDFDYNTFHRIKLNDEVTFPDLLNLNSFIPSSANQDSPCTEEYPSVGVKCDDSSTTDSGNLEDDCPPASDNGMSISDHSTNDNHDEDEDEGIERSNGPSTSNCNSHNQENEKNRDNRTSESRGPYEYELFSIMIHSGSASGGHYYAYIRDFRTGEWLCFNDQNVSTITYEDIQKTYGGGPTRAYYSGVYSSSTNAYMLMYRQIDPARNALPMEVSDFPKHLQELLVKMQDSEYNDMKKREMLMQMYRPKVFCHHPIEKTMKSLKLFCLHDETWSELTQRAYKMFDLDKVVDRDQVRLVTYQESSGLIDCSFDDREDETLRSILDDQSDLLMEIRKKDETFQAYLSGGVARKVYVVDFAAKKVTKGPINVRVLLSQTVQEFKEQLSREINMEPNDIHLILHYPNTFPRTVEKNDNQLQDEGFANARKIFVPSVGPDPKKSIDKSLHEIWELVVGLMSLNIQLPDLSQDVLWAMNIPTLKFEKKEKADETAAVTNKPTKCSSVVEAPRDNEKTETVETTGKSIVADEYPVFRYKTTSPPTIQTDAEDWHTPEQSNSEDSSLSYSDRTLVGEGDASEDDDYPLANIAQMMSNPANQLSSNENSQLNDPSEYFFNVTRDENQPDKLLRILVDKKMTLNTLKKLLEPYIGVPMEYFRVFCQPAGEIECSRLSMEMYFHDDGATLWIKLGLALRNGEIKVCLYQLLPDSETEPYKFLCKWIVSRDATVGQTKKEILAELKRKFDIDIPHERCRLRRKNDKTASNVFLDYQKIKDLQFSREIIIQELPDRETVTDLTNIVLFVRRMPTPDVLSAGPMQEFIVNGGSIAEVRKKLSEISGIPVEHLEIAKGKSALPDDPMLLLMQNFLDWKRYSSTAEFDQVISLENGTVIYYRDSREKPLELNAEVLQDIKVRRKSQMYAISTSTTSRYSPRRERALKIYVDDK